MNTDYVKYPEKVDLENCSLEPIHLIGKSQAHGVLLVCDPTNFLITQAGKNSLQFFSIPYDELIGNSLDILLEEMPIRKLREMISTSEASLPVEVLVNNKKFLLLAHLSDRNLILDFEPLEEKHDPFFFQKQLTLVLNRLEGTKTVQQLCNRAAKLTKDLFGYDRVMIYKFDEDWNGEVIAERKEEEMESWLGLHYPATDIPEQSRAIFLKHRVRSIVDVNYHPIELEPEVSPITAEPVDLSRSELRAVSPIHIEYLKNMGVGASLSAAIVMRGKLWGLIACHHRTAKYLDYYQRQGCRFLVQMLSTQLALQETKSYIRRKEISEVKRRELMHQMQQKDDLLEALAGEGIKFTDLFPCGGGAIFFRNRWKFCGITPGKEQVQELFDNFLSKQPESLYCSKSLSSAFPEAGAYKEVASGVMSLRIAERKYIIWFRPEVVQTVNWGGDPANKAYFNKEKNRLSPRRSFEKWTEKLTKTSEAWQNSDIDIAAALRENVSYILLARQRKEIEALNDRLVEANEELELFSYGLSHDLRAPIRGLEGYLTILKEDHSEELGAEGAKMLNRAEDLVHRMNQLIDDILAYSRLNHTTGVQKQEVAVEDVIKEILELTNVRLNYPRTQITIQEDLPKMYGDRRMLFQLWSNLLVNALKYSVAKDIPKVEVGSQIKEGKEVFYVKDNGIGIKDEFSEIIFETFTRVAGKGYTGSGIGLAIVKKVIEKHKGEIFLESIPDKGSVFYFHV